MFSFTRSRSLLRIKNSRSRSRPKTGRLWTLGQKSTNWMTYLSFCHGTFVLNLRCMASRIQYRYRYVLFLVWERHPGWIKGNNETTCVLFQLGQRKNEVLAKLKKPDAWIQTSTTGRSGSNTQLKQCFGSGMIYIGSSFEFFEFLIQAKVPDPCWSGSKPY